MDLYRQQAERPGDTLVYFSYARALDTSRPKRPARTIVVAAGAFVVFSALAACAAYAGSLTMMVGFATIALIAPISHLHRNRPCAFEAAHRVLGNRANAFEEAHRVLRRDER